MKKNIPNIITLFNLFFGSCAVVSVLYGHFPTAFIFVLVGVIADYSDGMIARSLNVHSELGKELDSLADMVTFGVVPGTILYMLLSKSGINGLTSTEINYYALPGFIVSVMAGLRLARFNLDTRQSEEFIGLPTPSCTGFIVGLMLIYHYDSFGMREWVSSPYFLYPVIFIFSYLMVSELPMFNLKFKGLKWAGNEIRFIFTALAIVFLLIFKEAAFSLIIFTYVLFSIIKHLLSKKTAT